MMVLMENLMAVFIVMMPSVSTIFLRHLLMTICMLVILSVIECSHSGDNS